MTKIDPTVTTTKCVLLLAVQKYNSAYIFNSFKLAYPHYRTYDVFERSQNAKNERRLQTQIYKCSKHTTGLFN